MTQIRNSDADEFQELLARRSKLQDRKRQLEAELISVNTVLTTFQPAFKFQILQRQRKKVVLEKAQIDMELGQLKTKLRECDPERKLRASYDLVKQIRDVRDKYQLVACGEFDHGPAERALAAQFVNDINPIIRRLCEP